MVAPYECEVRVPLSDVEVFRHRIASLDGRVLQEYAFSDHYFRPRWNLWDSRTHALRVREFHRPPQPSEVLLTSVEGVEAEGLRFKRSRFAEGKVRLYSGGLAECQRVVESLGFAPWLVVQKHDGVLYDLPRVGKVIVEHVVDVGWMSELEVAGTDPHQVAHRLREMLRVLEVDPRLVVADPVVAIVGARLAGRGRKAYFSGAIRGGRSLQPLYATIVAFLQQRGYEVLTAHVADPQVVEKEWRVGVTASDIYQRDLGWLDACDLLIAEVSTPSLGVGVELTIAQQLGKPVICLCQQEVALSAMVGGNDAVHLIRYQDEPDLLARLDRSLAMT